ncbi:MAG: hypothetical protein BWX61_00069 [Bacteroidetes bacterium ADurb.Bin035]|nr:MAG: hypothetical protein BWX61_00069 [Bacteroidetes bacterium ADurb.Bin035]
MQFTLILFLANSNAKDFAPAIKAPFVALYTVFVGCPTTPITLAIKIMLAPSGLIFFFLIICLANSKADITLTANASLKCLGSVSFRGKTVSIPAE